MKNIINFAEKKVRFRPKHEKQDITVDFLHESILKLIQDRAEETDDTHESDVFRRLLEHAKEEEKGFREVLTQRVSDMLEVIPLTTSYLEQQMQKIVTEMRCAIMEVFLLKHVKVLKPDLKQMIVVDNNNNNNNKEE